MTPWHYFCPCHFFRVFWTAILLILLILSAVLAFVFKSSVNIRTSALIKCSLLLSSPINSSKSSCRQLVKFSKTSNMLSVESASICFSSSYSSSSLLISSQVNVASLLLSASISSKANTLLVDTIEKLTVSGLNNSFKIFCQFLTKTVFNFWVSAYQTMCAMFVFLLIFSIAKMEYFPCFFTSP